MKDDLIKKCNYFIRTVWGIGVIEHGGAQHRDIVKIYFAGAVDALMTAGFSRHAQALHSELREEKIQDVDWRPDSRFEV